MKNKDKIIDALVEEIEELYTVQYPLSAYRLPSTLDAVKHIVSKYRLVKRK